MRKALYLFLTLLFVAASLAAKPGPGIMPKRRTRPKIRNSGAGSFILPRGPKYSQPDAPPAAADIPGIIAGGADSSPNQIAQQSLGLASGGDCAGVQARAQALLAQFNQLQAQLLNLLAKEQAEANAVYACPIPGPPFYDTSCQDNHSAKALDYANQALVLSQQALPWAAELQQLQAQAATCGNSGSGSIQAQPPAVTLGAMAKRFGFKLPSAAGYGGSGAAFGSNSIFSGPGGGALAQLEELDAEGEGANWDNVRAKGLRTALKEYASAAGRAAAQAPMIQAGRQLAKEKPEFDDPGQAAQAEFLRINYSELGDKYASLERQRHDAAEKVADASLSGLGPMAPIPDPEAKPLIPDAVKDALEEAKTEAQEKLMDKAKETLTEIYPQTQAAVDVYEMGQIVNPQENGLFDKLSAAVGEMGSGSLSNSALNDLLATIDGITGKADDKKNDILKRYGGLGGMESGEE